MTDFEKDNSEEWKKLLRSELINAFTEDLEKQNQVAYQIGYYYSCCAPTFLYKYYTDKPDKLEMVKSNKMWYSAPCNFNDVFDCDIQINEKEIFNCVLKMFPDKRGIRPGSSMWLQVKQAITKEIPSLENVF